jgi:hypothetical protein
MAVSGTERWAWSPAQEHLEKTSMKSMARQSFRIDLFVNDINRLGALAVELEGQNPGNVCLQGRRPRNHG